MITSYAEADQVMQELLYKLQIYDMQFSNTSNVQQCIYYMQFSLVICYNCLYMCCKLIGDKEIAVSQFSVQYYILLLSFLLHSVYKKLCFSSIISSKHFMQLTLDSSLCFLSFFFSPSLLLSLRACISISQSTLFALLVPIYIVLVFLWVVEL